MTQLVDRLATPRRLGVTGAGLVAVLALVTMNAIYGGVGLIRDGMGMPQEWLASMPLHSWAFGGAALLLTVAVPQAVTGWLVLARHPRAAAVALLAGGLLVGWIVVELLVLRRYFFLQPLVAVLGAAECALAWRWSSTAGQQPLPPG